jgi:putative ABC transport system permease protein
MRALDISGFALQALRRYPLRTGMMLLAIGIGVAAVVTLTGVGEAARRYVAGEFESLGTNTLIVLPGKADTSGAGIAGLLIGETARDLTLDDAIALQRDPRIVRVAPIIVGGGLVSWRARSREVAVFGANAALQQIQRWEMGAGRFLPELDIDTASPVCAVGHVIAEEVIGADNVVGQWLRIGDMRCRVVGVLAQGGISGAFNVDEAVFVPVASAQQLFDAAGLFRIVIETRNRDDLESVRRFVVATLKERHQGVEDVTVIRQDAILDTFDSIFGVITMALAGIAAISLIVAGVLIMNVMLVAVSQRTNEIGLLKALGATQGQIVAIFLVESAWLSALGAALGIAVGYAAAWAMSSAWPFLNFTAPVWASASGVGIALVCGVVFGLLPARRAARLDPVMALAA